MADIRSKLNSVFSLEQLAGGDTLLHRLHPGVKLAVTGIYLLCVVSVGRYDLGRLLPYLFYPAVAMALGEIPWGMIAKRGAVALPFVLFAGVSNLIFDRTTVLTLGPVAVTGGLLSLITLLLRTLLCVGGVLILVAVTPFPALTAQLRRLHLPNLLVMLLEMIYRYLSVLGGEAASMVTAYRLRGNGRKWPDVRHFGAFLGQLLLRSADRAERIYHAMECRLYALGDGRRDRRPLKGGDWAFLLAAGGASVLFRAVDVTALLGGIFA